MADIEDIWKNMDSWVPRFLKGFIQKLQCFKVNSAEYLLFKCVERAIQPTAKLWGKVQECTL